MAEIKRFKTFRKIQTIVSLVLFAAVFIFCWNTSKFELKNIQLSYWGIDEHLGFIWNLCIAVLSISTGINTCHYIASNNRMEYKNAFYVAFVAVSISLFITGVVTMAHPLHDITARFYFFVCPLSIFMMAHWNRKHLQYSEWFTHTAVSISMVVVPLILLELFHGMAIAETAHSVIAIGWNIWLLSDD